MKRPSSSPQTQSVSAENTTSVNDDIPMEATQHQQLTLDTNHPKSDGDNQDVEKGGWIPASAALTADSSHSLEHLGGRHAQQRYKRRQRESSMVTLPPNLEPPLSSSENLRDALLRFLDHPFFQTLGIIVLVLIILSGAFFFFLLLGWHNLCDTPSKTNCEPRNTSFNIAIQILNGLFTYMALESMPWRCTQFVHVMGWSYPYRRNDVGYDMFGLPSREIWYHIPWARRRGICLCLLLNCATQFANQTTRIVVPTFAQADVFPGNLWTNIFFVASMLCAALGGVWMLYEEHQLHQQQPDVFAPSAIMLAKDFVKRTLHKKNKRSYCCFGKVVVVQGDDDDDNELDASTTTENKDNNSARLHHHHLGRPSMVEPPDHVSTLHHKHVLPVERTNARLWGL